VTASKEEPLKLEAVETGDAGNSDDVLDRLIPSLASMRN